MIKTLVAYMVLSYIDVWWYCYYVVGFVSLGMLFLIYFYMPEDYCKEKKGSVSKPPIEALKDSYRSFQRIVQIPSW